MSSGTSHVVHQFEEIWLALYYIPTEIEVNGTHCCGGFQPFSWHELYLDCFLYLGEFPYRSHNPACLSAIGYTELDRWWDLKSDQVFLLEWWVKFGLIVRGSATH